MSNVAVEEVVEEVVEHYIHLKGGIRKKTPPYAVCTCGEWKFGPHKSLMTIGQEAKAHAEETGHKLRQH